MSRPREAAKIMPHLDDKVDCSLGGIEESPATGIHVSIDQSHIAAAVLQLAVDKMTVNELRIVKTTV